MQVPSAERLIRLRGFQRDSKLVEAFLRRFRGGSGHRVGAAGGFREGRDVANVGFSRQERDKAVDPKRKTAVRRRAHLQRLEQEAELRPSLLVAHAACAEDALLDVPAVEPDKSGYQ